MSPAEEAQEMSLSQNVTSSTPRVWRADLIAIDAHQQYNKFSIYLINGPMKFAAKHLGKWVAAKDDKVIANATSLNKLVQKVKKTEDPKNLTFSLVPKGFIAGLRTR